MPEFAPGEAKAAIAPITVKPAGLSCEAEIFLGPDDMTKVTTSGRIAFTSTGTSQGVRLPITMPDAEGTYHVYIDIYAEGYRVAAYQAIEDVVIAAPVALGMITLYATGLRTFYWPGGVAKEGTPYERYLPPGYYADWDTYWYYADEGKYRTNPDDYYAVKTQNDPCTPPEPIDLNNLLIEVHDYWSDEICPATGYGGACIWGPFGPFVVEDGGVYTINIRTGELIEGRV